MQGNVLQLPAAGVGGAQAQVKPLQSAYKAPTKRVDWEAIGSTKLVQGCYKASTKLLQSTYKASARLPQSYPKASIGLPTGVQRASPRLPYGYPTATPRLPTRAGMADLPRNTRMTRKAAGRAQREAPCLWRRVSDGRFQRLKVGESVLKAWGKRIESVLKAWGLRVESLGKAWGKRGESVSRRRSMAAGLGEMAFSHKSLHNHGAAD